MHQTARGGDVDIVLLCVVIIACLLAGAHAECCCWRPCCFVCLGVLPPQGAHCRVWQHASLLCGQHQHIAGGSQQEDRRCPLAVQRACKDFKRARSVPPPVAGLNCRQHTWALLCHRASMCDGWGCRKLTTHDLRLCVLGWTVSLAVWLHKCAWPPSPQQQFLAKTCCAVLLSPQLVRGLQAWQLTWPGRWQPSALPYAPAA